MKISQGHICPHDQSAVACVGEHTDDKLIGKCQYCRRSIEVVNTHPSRPSRNEERIAELEAEIARLKGEEASPVEQIAGGDIEEPEGESPEPEPEFEPEHHDDAGA